MVVMREMSSLRVLASVSGPRGDMVGDMTGECASSELICRCSCLPSRLSSPAALHEYASTRAWMT